MSSSDRLAESRDDTSKLHIGRGYLSQDEDGGGTGVMQDGALVVIVGAGLAGLAAAQRLHANGVSDVVVLDAQNRVGGRVHTIEHADYLLELGAQWLHGAYENPLHSWLAGMSMLDDYEDSTWGLRGTFVCTPGQAIDASLVERILEILNGSKFNLFTDDKIDPQFTGHTLTTASQVFRQHLEASLAEQPELDANRQLVEAIFEWFLRYETIENCCDHMDDVSVQSYTDWTDLGDGALLNFKDGYQSLLAWFCDHLPHKQWVHLNKQVLNVELLTSGGGDGEDERRRPLIVKYKDLGSSLSSAGCEIKTIECQHVIVTASLGFLKQNSRGFFTPPLPSAKQTLIDSLGFGTVNKIFLQFERPFWCAANGSIKLVWRCEDFNATAACDDGPEFPLWARDILAFDVVRRQPNVLIGWIGGRGAKAMESQTDEQVGEVCLRILEKFLPKSHRRPTRLVACLCSRWHSNPFTCGSYSFQSIDSFGLDVEKLHEPIYEQAAHSQSLSKVVHRDDNNNNPTPSRRVPRIMFAGEATAGKIYSTTHGAIISGWREAGRLLDHLASANKQPMTQAGISSLESSPAAKT